MTMTQSMPMKGTSAPDEAERLIHDDGFPMNPAIREQLREAKAGNSTDSIQHRVDVFDQMSPKPAAIRASPKGSFGRWRGSTSTRCARRRARGGQPMA